MDVGMDDVAEDHVPDRGRLDARAAHRLTDNQGPQLRRRLILQAAAVLANRRAHRTQHHNLVLSPHRYLLATRRVVATSLGEHRYRASSGLPAGSRRSHNTSTGEPAWTKTYLP